MISVSALAIGYMLMNIFFNRILNVSGDVCKVPLFGSTSILTLTSAQVKVCVILSVLSCNIICVFYHKIFCVTFDEIICGAATE